MGLAEGEDGPALFPSCVSDGHLQSGVWRQTELVTGSAYGSGSLCNAEWHVTTAERGQSKPRCG